jgi:hypothetical protein
MTELRPCPWQKPGEDHLLNVELRMRRVERANPHTYRARVYCETCGCKGPWKTANDQGVVLEWAEDAWNDRQGTDEKEMEVHDD